jgi:hypothetical protein
VAQEPIHAESHLVAHRMGLSNCRKYTWIGGACKAKLLEFLDVMHQAIFHIMGRILVKGDDGFSCCQVLLPRLHRLLVRN